MSENPAFRLLEKPWFYRLIQSLLAPGADELVVQYIQELLAHLPPAHRMVDIGCGPSSWLWRVDEHPLGVDISPSYSSQFHIAGEPATTASAGYLPFASRSFDGVWSVGMLHHLHEEIARQALQEFERICSPDGYIVMIDAVLPKRAWRRPLAYAVRRSDRGRYVRSQSELESLLPARQDWTVARHRYSYTGLEILVCWRRFTDRMDSSEGNS